MSPELAKIFWLVTIALFGLAGMFFWARSIYKNNKGRTKGGGWIISGSFDGCDAGAGSLRVGYTFFAFYTIFLTLIVGILCGGLGMLVGSLLFQWAIPSGSF